MYEIWEVKELEKDKLYALKELWTKHKTIRNLIFDFYWAVRITGRPRGNKFFVYLEKGQKLNDPENPIRLSHYPYDSSNIASFSWIDGLQMRILDDSYNQKLS
jgi:hypothetical protein